MNYSMKTTNKSFISMWRYLQRMYVEDNLFMLQTNDPQLVDFSIDKYKSMDKDDPSFKVYRDKVIQEAKDNIWFYFRELAVIPDANSITGYKRFELTPQTMMMIYLYANGQSFINTNPDNELCLLYLWNRTRSFYNTDIVMVNDNEVALQRSNTIKKCIAAMPLQIHFGSTQIISDNIDHFVPCNTEAFQNFYLKNTHNTFSAYAGDTASKYLDNNPWVDDHASTFIIEDSLPLLAYPHILELQGGCFYLNSIHTDATTDKIILDKFLKMLYPIADPSIYDSRNLEPMYLI